MRTHDSLSITQAIRGLTTGIATFLRDHLAERNDFGMRSFYGEAFTLALLARANRLDAATEAKLLRAYQDKNRADPQYHWEFNHYGMLEAGRLEQPLRFKHTSCTNWTLLRANVRLRSGGDASQALQEARAKIKRMQKPSGLILDDPGVKSFQYHCFSAAMLFEMHQHTLAPDLLEPFLNAVRFIRNFILPDGDTLYVGRGQQQSFGYASLIYILSAAYSSTGDARLLDDLHKVVKRLASHAHANGSLPLVIGGGPEPLPHSDTPHHDTRYPGWYAYNNYFDYLPFAGLFLHKAAELLATAPVHQPALHAAQRAYRDEDFIKVVAGNTIAVISRPGGYWTNDLPVPYVFSGGRVRTGCYGGEQFGGGLYSLRGLPLPLGRTRSLRWRAKSFFVGQTMIVVSPYGVLIRRFDITERRVGMHTRLLSPFSFKDRYLFPADGPVIRSTYPMEDDGVEYSASGPLRAVQAAGMGEVILEFPE